MKNKKLLIGFVVVTAICIMTICIRVSSNKSDDRKEVVIGAALNLTGAASEYGKCGMDAIKVIESQLDTYCNTKDIKIKFIIEDTGSTAKGTIDAYNAIRLKAPNCNILLSQGSVMGAAIAEFTKRDKVVQFSAGALSSPIATNPYFFVNISDERTVAKMFLQHTNEIKSALVFYIDDDFGNSVCSILDTNMPGKFVKKAFSQDTNVRSLVAASNWKATDVVLLIGWGPNMLNVIKALREAGYNKKILSTTELQTETNKKALAQYSKDIYCMAYSQPPKAVLDAYWDCIKKKDLYIADMNIYNAVALSIKAIDVVYSKGDNIYDVNKIVKEFNNPDVIKVAPCIVSIEDQRIIYKMEFTEL